MTSALLRALAVSTAVLAAPLTAVAQDIVHIRGTIEDVNGPMVAIAALDGLVYEVRMAEEYTLILYRRIGIDDVAPGDFLSIPSVATDDGGKEALSINVFPEAMRGTNEGVSAWDLTEDSLMTNATVGEVVSASDGSVIVVRHGETEEPVLVPEGTEITRFGPDPDRRLRPGDEAILFASEVEGEIRSNLAGISETGDLPPV